jgi:hypothetical protein
MAGRGKTTKDRKPPKPELFIGSSAEAGDVAAALEANLAHHFNVTPWTAGGSFQPGHMTLQELERHVHKSDFGVFVFSKDDVTTSRGKQQKAPRDNVVFEAGLFIGGLGRENCFIVAPQDYKKLKMPSDLEGFHPATYDHERFLRDGEVGLSVTANGIRSAITRRLAEKARAAAAAAAPGEADREEPEAEETLTVSAFRRAGDHVIDLLQMVGRNQAGLTVAVGNKVKMRGWAQTVLKMTHEVLKTVTPGLPDDAYVVWLKPKGKGAKSLELFEAYKLPEAYRKYYKFALGEGLAGTVWEEGKAGVHCKKKPHAKWTTRAGCDNASYVCVSVGAKAGPGGVLGFGSDTGFRVNKLQTQVMHAFAAILSLASKGPSRKG